MDLSLMDKEKADKAVSRKRRQQSVAAGFSRFAELEQAVQEIRSNALQVVLRASFCLSLLSNYMFAFQTFQHTFHASALGLEDTVCQFFSVASSFL